MPYRIERVGIGGVSFECDECVGWCLGEESAGVLQSGLVWSEDEDGGGIGFVG